MCARLPNLLSHTGARSSGFNGLSKPQSRRWSNDLPSSVLLTHAYLQGHTSLKWQYVYHTPRHILIQSSEGEHMSGAQWGNVHISLKARWGMCGEIFSPLLCILFHSWTFIAVTMYHLHYHGWGLGFTITISAWGVCVNTTLHSAKMFWLCAKFFTKTKLSYIETALAASIQQSDPIRWGYNELLVPSKWIDSHLHLIPLYMLQSSNAPPTSCCFANLLFTTC